MDPNATFRLMLEALQDGDLCAAHEACADLAQWLRGGGFLPAALDPTGGNSPSRKQLMARYLADTGVILAYLIATPNKEMAQC